MCQNILKAVLGGALLATTAFVTPSHAGYLPAGCIGADFFFACTDTPTPPFDDVYLTGTYPIVVNGITVTTVYIYEGATPTPRSEVENLAWYSCIQSGGTYGTAADGHDYCTGGPAEGVSNQLARLAEQL